MIGFARFAGPPRAILKKNDDCGYGTWLRYIYVIHHKGLLNPECYSVFFDSVVAVAQRIPGGLHRLFFPVAVRGAGQDRIAARLCNRIHVLPLPPGKGFVRAYERRWLPGIAVIR